MSVAVCNVGRLWFRNANSGRVVGRPPARLPGRGPGQQQRPWTADAADKPPGTDAEEWRDRVATKMNAREVAEAEELLREQQP